MTLEEMLQRGDRLPVPVSISILRQCAQELDNAHQLGRVHGGLTPGRIFVYEVGGGTIRAEVKDYAAGRPEQEQLMVGLAPPQFAAYMSPEEILGTVPYAKSDEFSLAVIAYEVLCGRRPFQSRSLSDLFFEICSTIPPAPQEVNPELSATTGDVLQQALAKDPSQRYSSCGEFVEKLEKSLQRIGSPPPVEPSSPLVEPSRPQAKVTEPISTPTTYDLPPARRRVYADDAETVPTSKKPRSAVLTFGLYALAGIVVLALAARLVNWHPKPTLPVQVLDPHTGSATPPPGSSSADQSRPALPANNPPAEPHAAAPKPAVHGPEHVAAVRAPHTTASAAAVQQLPNGHGTADVEILTQPPGAHIIVDNRSDLACTSPCTLVLPPGRHVLSADAPGLDPARRIFHTPDERSLLIAMNRSAGTLLVTSTPSGATLQLDGHDAGRTPTSLHLSPGQHRLDAFLGSQVQQRIVQVQPDAIESMTFDLHSQ
jgi:serine/threonine-protein kinase